MNKYNLFFLSRGCSEVLAVNIIKKKASKCKATGIRRQKRIAENTGSFDMIVRVSVDYNFKTANTKRRMLAKRDGVMQTAKALVQLVFLSFKITIPVDSVNILLR